MQSSRENRRYAQWNLVSTGEMLCRRFTGSSVVVIRPAEMKDDTFSRLVSDFFPSIRLTLWRFSNFVPDTNEYGDPVTYQTTDLLALQQLRALNERIKSVMISDDCFHRNQSRPSSAITLVGFSKGCVVLNQFLHELTALRQSNTNKELLSFASSLRTFVWLDGGHNNGDRTMIWPTDANLVSTLKHFHIQTEVFVTPFQINAKNPYKRHHHEHYQKFSELLLSLSNSTDQKIVNQMVFSDQRPSIDKHFELLSDFASGADREYDRWHAMPV